MKKKKSKQIFLGSPMGHAEAGVLFMELAQALDILSGIQQIPIGLYPVELSRKEGRKYIEDQEEEIEESVRRVEGIAKHIYTSLTGKRAK